MTEDMAATDMLELSQPTQADKMDYVIFGRGRMAEVWLIRRGAPKTEWRFLHLFHTLEDARAAVARYLQARDAAKRLGCRL